MSLKGPAEKTRKNYIRGGFTLLEIIIVLSIMSFMTAMVVPSIGHMNNTRKAKGTHEILESIRTAIIGPPNIFDKEGRKVIGGYVSDMHGLPKLYESEWDGTKKRWVWKEDREEIVNGKGQPRGLWEKGPEPGDILPAPPNDAPDYSGWKGPYLYYPRDPYPERAKNLDPVADWELFEKKQVEGKLSDAWGRVLYFIKEDRGGEVDLLLISAGPDGKTDLTNPIYNENAQDNKDNIVIKITHSEWFLPINAAFKKKMEDTERTVKRIREALLGADAFDASGRRITGGYLGDMGKLPHMTSYFSPDGSTEYKQPENLWKTEPGAGNGFEWRGPYIQKPADVLRDAWRNPIHFELAGNELSIVSGGPDGDLNTLADNITEVIEEREWRTSAAIEGWIYNETNLEKTVTISLYHDPANSVSDTLSIPANDSASFLLQAPDVVCGKRLLEITGDLNRKTNVFVGRGGTQSPAADRLNFYIR